MPHARKITALILAAGRGSRMLELTQNQPKCLISLAGRPLLEWQADALKKAGVKDIFIVGGYLADSLTQRGYRCVINPLWEQTNMVESLYCAHEVLSCQETIVGYGDIVYHPSIIKALLEAPGELVITYDLLWESLWRERFENPLDDAETLRIRKGKIVEIGKKPTELNQIEGQYMGLLKITPHGWAGLRALLDTIPAPKRRKMDMTTLLQVLIDCGMAVHGTSVEGRWCEADTQDDIQCYEKKLQENRLWSHDWRS